VAGWPQGEPLLALLAASTIGPSKLEPLVDGWELLLGEGLDADGFAAGRARGWAALAAAAEQPAREWALVDLALHLGTAAEADSVWRLARAEPWQRPSLSADLRPLLVLHGLAKRALQHEASAMLEGPGAMLLAMRLGILGR
jgi:phytoene synthase